MHAQAETQQRAELRLAFLRHLPKRAEAIGRRGRRFCRDGWDINGLSLLYEDVQRLAETASSGKARLRVKYIDNRGMEEVVEVGVGEPK